MIKLISRKEALGMIDSIFTSFHFGLMSLTDSGIDNAWDRDYFWAEANKVDQGRLTKDYEQTVSSLDAVGFKAYYKYIGTFASKYKIGCWEEYNQYEPILIEELNDELGKHKKTEEKLDLIDSFSVDELQSDSFIFDSKVQVLYDILDDFIVGDNKEKGINKVLSSFNSSDKSGFISKIQSDKKLLNSLIDKVNGNEKDEMFALIGEIFISSGFIKDQKAVLLNNKKTDTVSATFEKGKVFIDVRSQVSGGGRDYATTKTQSIPASPFDIIGLNYDGREIRVPALLLLNSWSNSAATPEGIFFNYKDEDIDWKTLDAAKKDEYFYSFVAHYLPSGFIEALGSPLQMVITGLITVGLAIATGGASAIAELEVVLAASGLALTGVSVYGSIRGIMAANDMKESATTIHEAKKAAKVMAQNVAQLSLNVVDLILTTKDLVKAGKNKTVKLNSDTSITKDIHDVYFDKLEPKSVRKLRKRDDCNEILNKYIEYFGDNVTFVNELINQTPGKIIYIDPEKLITTYLSKNKINVESIKIKEMIKPDSNFDKLKKTIDLINSNVKDVDPSLLKSVPLDTAVNKETAFMKELNTILEKKGMTLERYKEIVLRNIDDTSNLPPEGSEELKQLVETIRSIREEAVGKLDKDVEFRKFITQEDLIKYLNGEYNTVGGYISRDCDSSVLKEYNEIFNTARLDYPNTAYKPNEDKFIAYIKFKVSKSSQIKKIEIPYSELFSGSSKDLPPVSGSGILNSKNGVLIPEFKAVERLEIMDGAELHIISRDNNNTDKLIGIFSGDDQKFIIKGEQ